MKNKNQTAMSDGTKSHDSDQSTPIIELRAHTDAADSVAGRKHVASADTVQNVDDDFDPYRGGCKDGIGRWAASAHIVRNTVGSGILLMPYMMKNLGYVTGTALVLCASLVYYHTVHVLVAVEYRLCRRLKVAQLSFTSVADHVWRRAPYPLNRLNATVRYAIYLYYGIPVGNVVFLIVMATNIRRMAEYIPSFAPAPPTTHLITVLIVPLTAVCMHQRILQLLVPFSTVTNVFSVAMAAIVVAFSAAYRNPRAAPRPFGDDLAFVPQALATYVLAVRCTGIVIPLKNCMRRPATLSTATGALNVAGLFVTALYYAVGLVAYVNYGDEVADNVLANLPANNWLSFVVYLLYTLALFVAYVLGFFVRFQTVWSGTLEEQLADRPYRRVVEYAIRVAINATAYTLAVSCPHLPLIAALSGTTGIVVEIALPAVLELLLLSSSSSSSERVASDERDKSAWLTAKNACIIGVSCTLFAMSAARCVTELRKLYS